MREARQAPRVAITTSKAMDYTAIHGRYLNGLDASSHKRSRFYAYSTQIGDGYWIYTVA